MFVNSADCDSVECHRHASARPEWPRTMIKCTWEKCEITCLGFNGCEWAHIQHQIIRRASNPQPACLIVVSSPLGRNIDIKGGTDDASRVDVRLVMISASGKAN